MKTGSRAKGKVKELLPEILHWIEVGVAVLAIAFVAIGTVNLILELGGFWGELEHNGLHTVFEDVLSEILLLVVGIELAILLVRRTPESLVEVMFFVIARKTLIKTGTFYELLIGVVALAGLFAIRKYLTLQKPKTDLLRTEE